MINISDTHRRWATIVFETAVSHGATDKSVDEYLERIHQEQFDALVAASCESWKPVEPEEVKARREDVIAQLKAISPEKLEIIEAALEAAVAP